MLGKKLGACSIGVPILAALLACSDGGANANQKGVGDGPGGVELGYGDIAVSPHGGYLLFERDDQLAVGWPERGGDIVELPVSEPTRLVFSKTRPVVYVGTTAGADAIVAVDVSQARELWRVPVSSADTQRMRLAVSSDDRYLTVTEGSSLSVIRAGSGQLLRQHDFAENVVDIDILPDNRRAVVTTQHQWSATADAPESELLVVNLELGAQVSISVPNCADQLAVTADGLRAFLAPTRCQKDPVSVIDLSEGSERFLENLPGFGPVVLDGNTAVAFYATDRADPALFADPADMPSDAEGVYHLMLIDPIDLSYRFAPVGDALPRYAMTPDGQVLLVDSSEFLGEGGARLFDIASMSFRQLGGAALVLDAFSISSDSAHAYVLDGGVFDIDIAQAWVKQLPVPFEPLNINIAADDQSLYLRQDETDLCIYSLATQSCVRTLHYPPVVATR